MLTASRSAMQDPKYAENLRAYCEVLCAFSNYCWLPSAKDLVGIGKTIGLNGIYAISSRCGMRNLKNCMLPDDRFWYHCRNYTEDQIAWGVLYTNTPPLDCNLEPLKREIYMQIYQQFEKDYWGSHGGTLAVYSHYKNIKHQSAQDFCGIDSDDDHDSLNREMEDFYVIEPIVVVNTNLSAYRDNYPNRTKEIQNYSRYLKYLAEYNLAVELQMPQTYIDSLESVEVCEKPILIHAEFEDFKYLGWSETMFPGKITFEYLLSRKFKFENILHPLNLSPSEAREFTDPMQLERLERKEIRRRLFFGDHSNDGEYSHDPIEDNHHVLLTSIEPHIPFKYAKNLSRSLNFRNYYIAYVKTLLNFLAYYANNYHSSSYRLPVYPDSDKHFFGKDPERMMTIEDGIFPLNNLNLQDYIAVCE